MTYGYSRCSTNESKQDLNRQTRELKQAGAEIVFEEFEHGDAESKKELNKLFEVVQAGDTIITTEVSRLSRSTKQLCEIIDKVKAKSIRLQILGSITIDCRDGKLDPMTEAFLQMAGVFSQLELSMIRDRVKSGMANAKAKGKQIGRPKLTADALPDGFYKGYALYQNGAINKVEFSRMIKVSRPTLDGYLKVVSERGATAKAEKGITIKTKRG